MLNVALLSPPRLALAAPIYQDGKLLFEKKNYELAWKSFQTVQNLLPGEEYHQTTKYIEICKVCAKKKVEVCAASGKCTVLLGDKYHKAALWASKCKLRSCMCTCVRESGRGCGCMSLR